MSKRRPTNGEHRERCDRCGDEVVAIALVVDGTNLEMRSCATCDTRTWHLGRQPVDMTAVLAAVGHGAGRRRR